MTEDAPSSRSSEQPVSQGDATRYNFTLVEIAINELRWVDWSVDHIARHSVTRDEVDEVCDGDYVAFASYAGRVVVVGSTRGGRLLRVVLAPEPDGVWFVVTAHRARPSDERVYQSVKGPSR